MASMTNMLEVIIKELTVTNNDDHITNAGVLAWLKRGEVQRAQAAVLNTLTELRQFNKTKVSKREKEDTTRALVGWTLQWQPCKYCGGVHPIETIPSIWEDVCRVLKDGTFQESMLHQKK